MKIISKHNGGAIIEATDQELARILGYDNQYKDTRILPSLHTGSIIEVNTVWEQAFSAAHKAEILTDLRNTLSWLRNTARDVVRHQRTRTQEVMDIAEADLNNLSDKIEQAIESISIPTPNPVTNPITNQRLADLQNEGK